MTFRPRNSGHSRLRRPSAVSLVSISSMAAPEPLPQDELALVKEELRPLRQQLREAAAKQERNDRLLSALEHEIRPLVTKEQVLLEKEHAKQLEAQATGARPRQQMMIWVKALKDGPAIQAAHPLARGICGKDGYAPVDIENSGAWANPKTASSS